ncbi:MAG: hypothetical protein IT317_04750 [Anaerolineales bacterium]|nr:hypothetical protein [Anaerolineales bacterium]
MAAPKNFDPKFWKANVPKDLVVDPRTQVNMLFLHNHYIHYPTLNINSKVDKVMYDRVNDIRQLTTGIKKTSASIKLALKNCKSPKHDKFKAMLDAYLELLREAERKRQNWIKIERGVGNTKHLQELVIGPGLDDVIRI